MRPLPRRAEEICHQVNAAPRLVAHLQLVHDVACSLTEKVQKRLPTLLLDVESLCFGAAIHDIGKALHGVELMEPGNKHESAGEQLLQELGLPHSLARFARTHAAWRSDTSLALEDLFVSLADTCWKGKREPELDGIVAERIAARLQRPEWEVYLILDEILQQLADHADERLAWQAPFSL